VRYRVKGGKTLLVDGPARVRIISGTAEVLGAEVRPEMSIIIREGKRLPFEADPEFEAEILMSEKASCVEIEGAAVPDSWRRAAASILSQSGVLTVLILGGVDSGKTGFCIYLANSALRADRSVAVMDCDLGQSDVGPPGTLSLCLVKKPITDLFRLFPDESVFIGVTSPSWVVRGVLEAAGWLRKEAMKKGTDLLIVNTDGWIDGDEALKYKAGLVDVVNPNFVVAIQAEDELEPLISSLEDRKIITVDSPENIKKRDRETRRLLRGFAYKKHLKGSKIRSFPLSWVNLKGSLNPSEERIDRLKEEMRRLLGAEIICCDETPNCVILLLGEGTDPSEEAVKEAEMRLGKRVLTLRMGDEKGLLVSLEGPSGRMLGVGTIHSINHENMTIKIRTPVEAKVTKIKVGQIKLSPDGNEEGMIFLCLGDPLRDKGD